MRFEVRKHISNRQACNDVEYGELRNANADWHNKISHSLETRFHDTQFWSDGRLKRLQSIQGQSASRG